MGKWRSSAVQSRVGSQGQQQRGDSAQGLTAAWCQQGGNGLGGQEPKGPNSAPSWEQLSEAKGSWPEHLAGQMESKERLEKEQDPSDISVHRLVGTRIGGGLQHPQAAAEGDLPAPVSRPSPGRGAGERPQPIHRAMPASPRAGGSPQPLFRAVPLAGASSRSLSLRTRRWQGVTSARPAAPETLPFPCKGVLWRLVNYSNLQIAVVELTSLERVKIFSLIEHLLPLIQSLFKGSFCCCCCDVPGFRYRHVLAVPGTAQPRSPHRPIP